MFGFQGVSTEVENAHWTGREMKTEGRCILSRRYTADHSTIHWSNLILINAAWCGGPALGVFLKNYKIVLHIS